MPRVLRDDLALELFCREPDIVTPVAIDVDANGRVWAIESNTHFPKEDYKRHPSDRILVISDSNGDGKADRFDTFADGLQQTMALKLHSTGKVYVATRRDVLILEDTDGDERADKQTLLARLETVEQYPHNGLSGFAFDGAGNVFFSIGENMGVKYRLTSTRDGSFVDGGPEGGSVFRMQEDGAKLERWAMGFWNTFHMTLDPDGRLFAVDNDPDSRPPCRLLHIVRGGDYGYRRWLGRKGLHPFTAWNGELPGTLPMVSGTGEAPSGVVWYDRANLPEDLRGRLLVTSWGDHRIEAYSLEPRGASFRSRPVPIVGGGQMFRPVGMAIAPDGSVYFSDWVDQDYHVHSKGRIWRLRSKKPPQNAGQRGTYSAAAPPFQARLEGLEKLTEAAAQDPYSASREIFGLVGTERDAFLEGIGVTAMAKACGVKWLLENRLRKDPRERLLFLLALRRTQDPAARAAIADCLSDPDLDVRRAAIQWVGEERLTDQTMHVEKALLTGTASGPILEAWLAATSLLAGEAPDARDQIARDDFLLGVATKREWPPSIRAFALRSVSPRHAGLKLELLKSFLGESDASIRLEALRTICALRSPDSMALLLGLSSASEAPLRLRREAIAGLTGYLPGAEEALRKLASSSEPAVALEAMRSLRLGGSTVQAKPNISDADRTKLLSSGDPETGEMLFFHPAGPRCSFCHSVRGRGGLAGPDLSAAGNTPRAKLLESILEPAKEVAPQFALWTLVTHSGVRSGTILGENADGTIRFADTNGVEDLAFAGIESREQTPGSLMPENLASFLVTEELRDVLAFLETLK